jgi:hypothetical protein
MKRSDTSPSNARFLLILFLIVSILGVVAALKLRGGDYSIQQASSTTGVQTFNAYTNTTNFLNGSIAGFEIPREHTFVIINAAATNGAAIQGTSNTTTLFWTLDNTNYVPFFTNIFTTNLATAGTILTGHFSGFKETVAESNGTNCNIQLQYDGGN